MIRRIYIFRLLQKKMKFQNSYHYQSINCIFFDGSIYSIIWPFWPSAAVRVGLGGRGLTNSKKNVKKCVKKVNCVIRPNFWFSLMASLKTFYEGKLPNHPICTLFRSDALVVFGRIPLVGWSFERLNGRSEEGCSFALPLIDNWNWICQN